MPRIVFPTCQVFVLVTPEADPEKDKDTSTNSLSGVELRQG